MKVIFTIFVVYALVMALVTVNQRKLMYHPHFDVMTAEHYGLAQVEAGKLDTEDGEALDYWYTPAESGQPVVLYFHGNGGHIGHRADFFRAAMREGYGVFMLSYRGYGGSTGSPSEKGFYLDAKAAYMHLRQELEIPEEQLIIYGESIGTGVAVELARGKQVKALVLQAPFTSAAKRAAEIYWWLPVRFLIKDTYDSISKVGDISAPVLVMAAENDRIVPARHAKELYDAFSGKKKFHMFEGIGHNQFNPFETVRLIKEF